MLEILNSINGIRKILVKPALALDFKTTTGMYDYAKPSRVFTRVGTNMSVKNDTLYQSNFNFKTGDTGYLETGNQPSGATGFYYTPDSPELRLTGDYTVEAHIRVDSLNPTYASIGILLAKGVVGANIGSRFYVQDSTSAVLNRVLPVVAHYDGVGSMKYTTSGYINPPIPEATFYKNTAYDVPYTPNAKMFHITFTKKGSTEYFFINGVLLKSVTDSVSMLPWGVNNNPLIIGNYADSNNVTTPSGYGCLGGRIKRLRIYQQCLYTKNFVPSTQEYDVTSDGDWVYI